jgi:hypothetical protein
MNWIIHNLNKFVFGFTVLKRGEEYVRVKAISNYVKIEGTEIQILQYTIIYDGIEIALPDFKLVMIHKKM